jgi:hypothetical protein
MKNFLYIALIFLFACNTQNKKNASGIAGEYKRGSSTVTIQDRKGKIDVSLCFADETCIEPCLTGLLNNAGPKRYSGWIYPETEDSVAEKQLVVIGIYKNEVDVLFPRGTGIKFGMNCRPEGVYKK